MKKSLFYLGILLFSGTASAQMSGWMHTEPLSITEHSGDTITNYQLPVYVNTQALIGSGTLLADGADLRFTSLCTGGTEYPYWIESGINTDSTKIWVTVDTINANEVKTIYMHYQNPDASAVSAINTTFNGPHSATDSTVNTNLSGSADAQRGFRFAPTSDILVTSMGKYTSSGNPRFVTLFDNVTQGILRQLQVAGPVAEFSYEPVAPIWLNQGSQYVLEIFCPAGDDSYYFGASPTVGQHIQYLDMRYCNGCTQNTFPTNWLGGSLYGYVDLWYWTKNPVSPAPTSEWTSFITNMPDSVAICSTDSVSIPLIILGGEAPFAYSWTGSDLTDNSLQSPGTSPAATTEYYVTIEDNCASVKTDSITVVVNELPSADIMASFSAFCLGDTGELSVSGADTYQWSNDSTGSSIVIAPEIDSVFSVTAVNADGCISTDSLYVDVIGPQLHTQTVNICFEETYTIGESVYSENGTYLDTIAAVSTCDSIVTTTLIIADEIDAGVQWTNTFTLVADTGADSYQWVDCSNNNTPIAGGNTSVFEVTANGSYACMVGVGNCTQLSDCFEMAIIGIGEYDLVENTQLYPNPNGGSFTVQTTQTQTLYVMDALGKKVASVDVTAGEAKAVSVENVEAGVYFLQSRTKTIRFVIE